MKFLLCADFHLREDRPLCRTDADWMQTQEDQLDFIATQANKYNVPIIICGDIFHRTQAPNSVISMFFRFTSKVKNMVYVIAGNHEIRFHSWEYIRKSSFGVIDEVIKNKGVNIAYPDEIGQYMNFNTDIKGKDTGLLFLHRLIFPSAKDKPPMAKGSTAEEVMAEYPDAEWIFAGDYHRSYFIESDEEQHLLVPGCINKQASDFKDYEPKIWLVDTQEGKVNAIFIPDDVEIVENSAVKERDERNNRIGAFMEVLKGSKKISFDYKANVESAMEKDNTLSIGTKNIIQEFISK